MSKCSSSQNVFEVHLLQRHVQVSMEEDTSYAVIFQNKQMAIFKERKEIVKMICTYVIIMSLMIC